MSAIQEELLIKIAADLTDLKKGMDGAEKSLKQGKQSAEGFKDGVSSITDNLKMFNTNIGGVNVNVGHMAQNTTKLITSIKAATVSTRAFGMALAATGIGAIVIALGALIAAFTSTQEGSDRLNRVLTPLKAVFGALWGVVQDLSIMLSDKLVAAFKDPQQAVKDLWEAIKQNLLNRLDGVIKAVQAAGRVIGASLKLDFEAAGEAAKDFGSAMLQAASGIVDLEGKVKGLFDEFADGAKRGAALGAEIEKLNVQIRKAELDAIVRREKLNLLAKEGERIATETKLSEAERLKGLEQARKATADLAAIDQNINNLKIKRIKLQNEINDTSDADLAEQYEIEAANIRINAQLEEQARKYNRIQNGIKDVGDLLDNMPEFELFDADTTAEEAEAMKEVFVNIGAMYDGIAEKINTTAAAAEQFAGIIANTAGDAFDALFDKSKGMEDFAQSVINSMQGLIRQLITATVRALILSKVLATLPGFGAAGAATSFGSILSQGMGAGQGSFRIRGGDLMTLNNQSSANSTR